MSLNFLLNQTWQGNSILNKYKPGFFELDLQSFSESENVEHFLYIHNNPYISCFMAVIFISHFSYL